MKYLSIIHPQSGAMIVQFSPHATHHDMLVLLGNPPCIGAGFVVIPDGATAVPIGKSQSLGKSPAMPDAKLLDQGYRLTRDEHATPTLFDQAN